MPFEEVIDTPDKAVETVGAAMDRLRQLAYRVPPDEDGHGAVTWQEEREQMYGLLAEAGMLLSMISVGDGVMNRSVSGPNPTNPYKHQSTLEHLIEQIRIAVGGNIMAAAMEAREKAKTAKGDDHDSTAV